MKPELLHVLLGAERGGCERNSLALILHLKTVAHRVTVFGPHGPMCDKWVEAGATVEVIDRTRFDTNRKLIATVRALTAAHPPAAVMFWHGLVHLPQFIHAVAPLGVPVAVHGGNPAHTMPAWADWKFVLLGKLYPPGPTLPTYVCCSQYVADSFESSRYLRRFPREAVPNGVELPTGPRHTPREYDPAREFVVGMLARLNSIKDHRTLLRALPRVLARFPNVVLEFAGGGEEEPGLRALAAELRIESAVRFLGDLSNVYAAMAKWDLFAYATTEREGLGNAVSEAMMLALPCVLTDIGPIHEFAGDGTATRMVPPHDPAAMADALTALIPDLATRESLSVAGMDWALDRFHPSAFAWQHAKILGLSLPELPARPVIRP